MTTVAPTRIELAQRWRDDRLAHPRSHARDAAARLGVAEVQLLATGCGETVTRLRPEWAPLVTALPSLGPVKTMTRNDHAVIEKDGTFADVTAGAVHGTTLGELDLRLFFHAWGSAFAVADPQPDGTIRRSLQIFDAHGVSVHKCFLDGAADVAAFETLIAAQRATRQDAEEPVAPPPAPAVAVPDAAVDVATFRAEWDALQDTHDFWRLLQRHALARTQALRLAGVTRARPVAVAQVEATLRHCADTPMKLMIFAGNRGALQVVSGPIHRVVHASGWLNVLDPGFNLHLRDTALTEAWVVHKPTAEGVVSSLEAFDAAGETVLMLHGYRKAGAAACAPWEAWLRALPGAA